MDVSEQLTRVDAATVAAVARQALGRPAAQVGRWEHRVAYGGLGVVRGTNRLLRVSGGTPAGGRPAPWSAYLKLTRVPPAAAPHAHAVTHTDYWRREIATYESALPAQLPDGLATPRCYGVVAAGDCVHLWLEDVQEDGGPWSLARYGLAGRHLGRFNGQYLAGRPRPAYPWLTRGFLRARADRNAPVWARLDALRARPLFAAIVGEGVGPEDLPALETHVFEGYLAGLRDAGWVGDARLARLGYAVTVALRYGPILGIVPQLEADEQQQAALTQTLGHPFAEAVARYGRLLPHVLDRADEARRLLAALPS